MQEPLIMQLTGSFSTGLQPHRKCQRTRSHRLHVRATATVDPPATPKSAEAAAKFTQQIVADEAKYVLQTYGRPADVVFVSGKGAKLYDAAGREYLDMAAGGRDRRAADSGCMHAAPPEMRPIKL
jgi:hypothetical protein